jgi:regulator of sigma E protease
VLFSAVFATGVTEPAALVAPPAAGTVAARAGFDGSETIVSIRDADGGAAVPVRSWSDLRWKLLSAAFDHREVVLGARDGGAATFDFRVDLRNIPRATSMTISWRASASRPAAARCRSRRCSPAARPSGRG